MNGTNSAVVTLARVLKVEVTDDTLSIDLEDGRSVSVPIGWYQSEVRSQRSEVRSQTSEVVCCMWSVDVVAAIRVDVIRLLLPMHERPMCDRIQSGN
jgi:hypothetical protein